MEKALNSACKKIMLHVVTCTCSFKSFVRCQRAFMILSFIQFCYFLSLEVLSVIEFQKCTLNFTCNLNFL